MASITDGKFYVYQNNFSIKNRPLILEYPNKIIINGNLCPDFFLNLGLNM